MISNILNESILAAVEKSDVALLKELLEKDDVKKSFYFAHILNNCVSKAAIHNCIDVIKLICENPKLEKHITYPTTYDHALIRALQYTNIEIIKYLSASPTLPRHANIHQEKLLSYTGDLEVIKYLLTDKNLKSNLAVETQNHMLIRNACLHGNIEVVQYLLTSPELIKKADIYCDDYSCFDNLCMYNGKSDEVNKNMKVLEWLLFEYKIELNPTIIAILKDHAEANKILDNYLLKTKLDDCLIIKTKEKKSKI